MLCDSSTTGVVRNASFEYTRQATKYYIVEEQVQKPRTGYFERKGSKATPLFTAFSPSQAIPFLLGTSELTRKRSQREVFFGRSRRTLCGPFYLNFMECFSGISTKSRVVFHPMGNPGSATGFPSVRRIVTFVMCNIMAHFHCRTRIQIRNQTRIPNPMAT